MKVSLPELQDALRRLRPVTERSTESIIGALVATAEQWRAPGNPWLKRAVEEMPAMTGFTPEMIHEAVNLTFASLTADALREVLTRELGEPGVLDGFRPRGATQVRASGPRLIAHFLAGNVPVPGIQSICFGLLLKSANIVKLASRDPVLPALFVESLRAVDAELGASVAALEWDRQDAALTQAAVAGAEAVIAFGDDRAMTALRQATPAKAAFLGYGNKISLALILKEAMTEANLPALAEAAAFDVSVFDQQGCLSPHVIYVEERGALGPRTFAAALAQAMAAYQLRVPRGTISAEEAAAISQTRQAYEFRAASDRRVAVWASPQPNDWTVIYDDDPAFAPSCLNRVVYVKPTDAPARVLTAVARYAENISTVGLEPRGERMAAFAADAAKLGIHRVCALGQMQRPPLWWFHDGKPNLAALVRWTELG
jgi:hypothetical protein